MYGLVLIAVLAVMGGIIAYIGDKLGSKVGKKKLTIFGLRPKHTSILVTIVTGILIAATTLGVLAMTSRDVRTALFGMKALKAELTSLSAEVAAKNNELAVSRTAMENMTAEYNTITAKVAETSKRLAAITSELAAVTQERDRTAAALNQLQADYALAQADLSRAQGELAKSQQEIAALQAVKNELDTKVNTLTEAKTALQQDVDRLNELTANLKQGLEYVREGIVIYRAGEMLSSTVIKGGQPLPETEKQLAGILYQSNQAIIAKLNIPKEKNLDVLWVAKNDFEKAATQIASTPQDVIVRVSSVGNTVYGEPVIGKIDLFPNRLVYMQNAVVYSQTIEVQSAQQAEEAVIMFLQKVNAEAIREGVLPDPIQGTVGIMSGSQLYDTINKVKRFTSEKIELSAVTKDNIYTVGPLRIEIQVKPIP